MLKSVYLKIWSILSDVQKKRLIFLFFMIFIGMILEMISVGIFMPSIISSDNSNIKKFLPSFMDLNGQSKSLIIIFLLIILLLYLVKGFYQAFLAHSQVKFAFDFQKKLSEKIFRLYLSQPISFFSEKNSSELVNNSINEITIFTFNGIIQGLLLLTEIFVTVGILTLLLYIEPRGTLIVLFLQGGSSLIFQKITQKKLASYGIKRQVYEQERIKHLLQGFSAFKEIKLRGAELEFINIYQDSNSGVSEIGRKQQFLQQLPRVWLEFSTILSIVLLVVYLTLLDYDLEYILPVVGVFAASAFRLLPSVNRILSCVHYLAYASPTIDKLHFELTNLNSFSSDTSFFNQLLSFKSIRIESLEFNYSNSCEKLFHGLNFEIKRNDKIAIIGKSGSGKSTIMDLLLGLRLPTTGSVKIDNYNLFEVSRSYHKLVGYVPQSVYLMDDTLKRNIAFGVPDCEIDIGRVRKVIELSNLIKVVESLPDDINTYLGENGGLLSGGQCQRIGIARALYFDPEILFFDEATSALDEATEIEIIETIFEISKEKTIFFITHKKDNLKYFDKIIDLDDII